MKVAPLATVNTHLSRYVDECRDGPLVVTRNGRPAAMLVPVLEGDDLERQILVNSPRFRDLLDAADERARGREGLTHAQVWKRVAARSARRRRSRRR